MDLLGDQAGDDGGDHDGNGQLVVGGQLEDHDDRGDRGAEHGAGHRPHADHGVSAGARRQLRQGPGRQDAEGATDHGADEKRGREHPARETTGQADGGRRRLQHDQRQ